MLFSLRKLAPALVLFASVSFAQRFEVSVSGVHYRIGTAPLGSINDTGKQDDDTKLRGKNGFAARFTWNTRGYYGHEFVFEQTNADLETKIRDADTGDVTATRQDRIKVRMASYNFLIYFMPAGEWWRPFITGGVQAHEYGAPNFAEWPTTKSRNYGGNWGGGIKLLPAKHVLFRLDARQYFGGKPYDLQFADPLSSGGILRGLEFSAGFGITF